MSPTFIQLVAVGSRQQIKPQGQHLAELDPGATELRERCAYSAGAALVDSAETGSKQPDQAGRLGSSRGLGLGG